jgi:hypothetical protein
MTIHNVDENAPWRNDPTVRARQAVANWQIAHERQLKHIVAQLGAATEMWKKGDVSEQSGRSIKQFAVLKMGQTLITGRDVYSSDKKFGNWLKTLTLEAPFDDRQERFAAMKIAKLFADEIALVTKGINDEDHRTTVESTLYSRKLNLCPHSRPNDILIWARKTGLIPRKKRNPQQTRKARQQIRVVVQNGQPVNRDEVSQATGLSNGGVGRAHAMEQARLEGVAEGEALALNAQGKFTKAQAKHVEALNKKLQRDLTSQFEAAVEAEVKKRTKAKQAALDSAHAACVKQREEAFKDQQHWRLLSNNRKPILTPEEFRMVVMALHPDNSASEETRARALQSITEKKLQLTGKP